MHAQVHVLDLEADDKEQEEREALPETRVGPVVGGLVLAEICHPRKKGSLEAILLSEHGIQWLEWDEDAPFRMLLIGLPAWIYLVCAQLLQSLVQLSRSPIKPESRLINKHSLAKTRSRRKRNLLGIRTVPQTKRDKIDPA